MQQLTPVNLLRLSFESRDEYQAYVRANQNMLTQIWLWHETLGDSEASIKLNGICDLCESQTTFTATSGKAEKGARFAFRTAWWGSALCACKMNNLDRAAMRILTDTSEKGDRIYHVGQYSRFRNKLSEKFVNIISSQYDESKIAGEIYNGVRYEDITCLSFSDQSFDCIICMEVLEHVPNYLTALRELVRTLKPKGRAILSFPWLGGEYYDHFIRAKLRPDGSIHHIHPPEYHGDPAKNEGILSFRNFGWKILDEMRDAGFASASAEYIFGPLHGYMTLVSPIIVGVR